MKRFSLAGGVVFVLTLFLLPVGLAHADVLGQSATFRTNATYDVSGATTVPMTLQAVGQHMYAYVDDRYWASLNSTDRSAFTAALANFVQQFDTVIYPTSTAFWGSENNPGIDDDPHIFIAIEQLGTGDGGYFQTINNYSKTIAPNSNQHEMIYVSAASVLDGSAPEFAAHEFQHLISFNQKELLQGVSDDVWLNEARSEYNITVAGYDTPYDGSTYQERVQSFVRNPSDSLVEWPNTTTDYGIASVFIHSVADQLGPQAVADTIHSPAAGVAAIPNFSSVFTNWMSSAFLTLHVPPQSNVSPILKEWQPYWFELPVTLGGNNPVTVHIAGASDVQWYGSVLAKYSNGSVQIMPMPPSANGIIDVQVPRQLNTSSLVTIDGTLTQGSLIPVGSRTVLARPATITLNSAAINSIPQPTTYLPVDGDLIRRIGESEIYVVWGPYRRYLPQGVLKLYGFENRPVISVSNDIFSRYRTSNYVREVGQQKVYALWPDGTKHWIDITAAQWDASGRDWGAIFTVNAAEVAWYTTGKNVVQ